MPLSPPQAPNSGALESGSSRNQRIRLECHACLNYNHHRVLGYHYEPWDSKEDGNEISGFDDHYILQCEGCQRIAYARQVHVCDGDPNCYDLVDVIRTPPVPVRAKPKWAAHADIDFNVPVRLIRLYNEVLSVIQIEAYNVAAMGIRAMFEFVLVEAVGDQGGFGKNIEAFVKKGHIGETAAGLVSRVLDVGSAAIHRGHIVKKHDVLAMLDLLDTIVSLVYRHPIEVNNMDAPSPRPRPVRSK